MNIPSTEGACAIGAGLVPMDVLVTALVWTAPLAAATVAIRLRGTHVGLRDEIGRLMLGGGLGTVAIKMTLYLLARGDLPMSLPMAGGLALASTGYARMAWTRIQAERPFRLPRRRARRPAR